jgi:hypothetical protein
MEHVNVLQVAVGVDVNLVPQRHCLEAADGSQRLPLCRCHSKMGTKKSSILCLSTCVLRSTIIATRWSA